MHQTDRTPFQKRCLAVSVAALCASLGACSTVPRDDGFGDTLARTGEATRSTTARVWDRTLYLLGFSDEAKAASSRSVTGDEGLLDEVDLAMREEDAVMPGATDVVRSSEWSDIAAADRAARESVVDEATFDDEALVLGETSSDPASVSPRGLTHEVGAGETLWDVAKMTTGDATNWHVLADVNDLAPDAAVYPGQTITVPADLVRPELAGLASTSERLAGEVPAAGAAPTSGRLAVPGADDAGERLAAGVSEIVESGDALAADMADAAIDPAAEGDAADGAVAVSLDAGETLWDFAKRTTGDATNWRAIAAANDFSEERATKVREGESIAVPTTLLKEGFAATGGDAPAPAVPAAATPGTLTITATAPEGTARTRDALVPIADAADVLEGDADGITDGASALAANADAAGTGAAGAGEPVRIVEAAYRAEPESVVAEQPAADSLPAEIMVSGTYYPKAVYNDADFSSSLLMRVSPGTTLQVSRAVGPWFEVSTDQGTGYVHARDIK